jgi:hypothetical protein
MMTDGRPLGERGERRPFFQKLGVEIEEFLLFLEANGDALVAYVSDPFEYLRDIKSPGDEDPNDTRPRLSNEAKAILLQSNYSVVKEAMKYRESTAVHWVCVWVI